MKHLIVILLFVINLTVAVEAQTTTTTVQAPVVTTTVQTPVVTTTVVTPLPARVSKATVETIAASSNKVVKNSPFSAEAVSESVQVLADGNKITRSVTTRMYRDSEGRFRREGAGSTGGSGFSTYGSTVAIYGMQETISIFDPVESARYVLNPTDKTARRLSFNNINIEIPIVVNTGKLTTAAVNAEILTKIATETKAQIQTKGNVVVMGNVASTIDPGKTESLGTKTIEGVETQGTRTVTTIEAGAIGNERPIEIVYERWYSKELDMIVYSRNYDPRFGEQTYRLTNINRTEPDRSLFTVPSDYKLISETPNKVVTTTKPQ